MYVFGGSTDIGTSNRVVVFENNNYKDIGNLKQRRLGHDVIRIGLFIYVIGGWGYGLKTEKWDLNINQTIDDLSTIEDDLNNFASFPLLYHVHPYQCSSCSKNCNNGDCVMIDGNEHCQCGDGFANLNNDPLNACKIIDCDTLPCGYGECINSHGLFTCKCPAGYIQGVGNQQCQQCEAGFRPGDLMEPCHDINECEFLNPCGFGTCLNSEGSFSCICPDGFLLGIGYKQCQTCDTGFQAGNQLGTCQDIDECKNFECGDGTCLNNIGSYNCICYEGFVNAFHDKSAVCGKNYLLGLDFNWGCI